ncbi:MAG: insulinase family protein, partial [Clostridiales bacterium]|nr:insulinase family protein [Clostridiales bacterium]
QEYLQEYDYREIDSGICFQTPFEQPVERVVPYPVESAEEEEGQAFLSEHWVVGENTDPILYVAFQVLETVLLTAPGAPLKQALMDKGIGADVFGGFQNASRQPYFSVVVRDARMDQKDEFLQIIRETLEDQVSQGLNRKSLLSAINSLDFKNREADFGPYPRGLMYGIDCFDSWLYDASPMIHLKYEDTFRFLREQLDTGYFESLIQKYMLENNHQAVLILKPEAGLTQKKDEELAKKLAVYKSSLTSEQIVKLVTETRELKEYQSEPSAPEQLETLPKLSLSDINPKAEQLNCSQKMIGETPVLHQNIFTSGIYYLRILFRADGIDKEEIPYLGLLRSVLELLSTEKFSYAELYREINLESGGIHTSIPVYQNVEHPEEFSPYFEMNGRILTDHLTNALAIMEEILLRTRFDDDKRLRELLAQFKSRAVMQLQNQGHATALLRASSYESSMSWFNDQVGGVGYTRFLDESKTAAESEQGIKDLEEHLKKLAEKLFTQENMLVSITTPNEDYESFAESFAPFRDRFPKGQTARAEDRYRPSRASWSFIPDKKNEAFKTAAQIQYVASAGNFRKAGFSYTGALRVLKKILGDEYLWINVRVKGGAYGCMCGFGRMGSGYFVSYRDPNLRRTLEVYQGIVPYLEQFRVSKQDMDNYIIGTIGTLDHPMNPAEMGVYSMQAFMTGVTQEMIQKDRDEVLSCDEEEIRRLAPLVQSILDCRQLCVVGNAGKIEEEKELFLHLESFLPSDKSAEKGEVPEEL